MCRGVKRPSVDPEAKAGRRAGRGVLAQLARRMRRLLCLGGGREAGPATAACSGRGGVLLLLLLSAAAVSITASGEHMMMSVNQYYTFVLFVSRGCVPLVLLLCVAVVCIAFHYCMKSCDKLGALAVVLQCPHA